MSPSSLPPPARTRNDTAFRISGTRLRTVDCPRDQGHPHSETLATARDREGVIRPVGTKHELEWQWFSLHSAQRMQMVSFWLGSTALLSSAAVAAIDKGLRVPSIGLCTLGAVASMVFALLDSRTRDLVRLAEARILQTSTDQDPDDALRQLVSSAQTRDRPYKSYRLLIQGLELSTMLLFAAGGVWCWRALPA